MSNTTYNGWANYATWRIHLELISDYVDTLDADDYEDASDLAGTLENYVDEVLESTGSGLALDYARAFASDADYHEMAEAALEDWKE